MKTHSKRKHRRAGGGPVGKLRRRIKRIYQNIFVEGSVPKEYRPYLGPDAKPEEVEERKFENTRYKPRKSRRHRHDEGFISRVFRLRRLRNWMKESRKRRLKNKHKRHIRRKQRRKERRSRRIEFIRKFIPNYKKSREVSVVFSQEESTEETDRNKPKNYLTYTANSTALYILAYLTVYMIYQFTVLVVASRWKLDSVLYYFDLAFNDFSPLWNRTNIIIVTFSGPFIALIIGIVFMRWLAPQAKKRKYTKLFVLWISLHGYNLFLGAFASGVSFDEGFGYVAAWLYMNIFWKILFSLIFLFVLGLIGYYAAPKFLETSYSVSRIKQQNKIRFLLYQVVLPWLIGGILIFLIKIPNNLPYDTANLITLAFAVVPMIFNRGARPTKDFQVEKRQNRIKVFIIIILVLALITYRVGLDNGLHFELYYRFIFSLNITPL